MEIKIIKRLLKKPYHFVRNTVINIKYVFFKKHYKCNVLGPIETIDFILSHPVSVSRFGDGEFYVMWNMNGGPFQKANPQLARRLWEIFTSRLDNHIVCIPYTFHDFSWCVSQTKQFVKDFVVTYSKQLERTIDRERLYYDTNFTRFYFDHVDKSDCGKIANMIQQLWKDQNLLIVEGESTRFGVGNNLLEGAKSVKRILCPSINAFDVYDKILAKVKSCASKDDLILCALGMTATVLAYDLSQLGFRAIDIGHFDIEYEWFKMGATSKCPVPHKAVNEAGYQSVSDNLIDKEYRSSIIATLVK